MKNPSSLRKDHIKLIPSGFDFACMGLPLFSLKPADEPAYDSDGFVPEDERDGG